MNDDFNARLRERLRNTDYPEPTSLERRLGRSVHEAIKINGAVDPACRNPIVKILVILAGIFGIISAAIPALLFSAIMIIPAYMSYTLFSGF